MSTLPILHAQSLAPSLAFLESGLVLFILIPILIGIPVTIFWIWMLIEVATKEPDNAGDQKIVWLLVVLLTGILGALIYFFVRRPQRITEHGR